MTIKFLGDIPEKELAAIKDIITQVLQEQPSFTIEIEGLGMYPNIRNPHVIWLGITHVKLIVNIHKMLDQALEKSGIKADRRKYSPHLTIARIRRGTGRDTITKIGKTFSQFKIDSLGPAVINEIRLYQSELTSIGPIYTPLLSIPLNQV